jgi:hypothetical protein
LRAKSQLMATTEDVVLIRRALAYAIELYRELTGENGAPTLGTQNQIVDFILADPKNMVEARDREPSTRGEGSDKKVGINPMH